MWGDVSIMSVTEDMDPRLKERIQRARAELEARVKKEREYWEKRAEWTAQKEMIGRALHAREYIGRLYEAFPHDTAELERLAEEILVNDEWVDDLMARVKGRVNKKLVAAAWFPPEQVLETQLLEDLKSMNAGDETAPVEASLAMPQETAPGDAVPVRAAPADEKARSGTPWSWPVVIAAGAIVACLTVWGLRRRWGRTSATR